jgi:hypothetical protein
MQEPTPETTQAVKAKEPKPAKDNKAKVKGESTDRLPASIDELKASKGGLYAKAVIIQRYSAEALR